MVAHELYEVRAHNGSVRAAGEFHDVTLGSYTARFQIGGIDQAEPKNEPFWGEAVWIPTSTAHVRVPEVNRLPVLRFTRSTSHGSTGANGLDAYGLPGFRTLGPDLPTETLAPIAQACSPWLPTRADAHVELRVRYGLVALTVNGYRADDADLRHLLATAEGVAEALAALTPAPLGVPFDTLGPAAGTVAGLPGHPVPLPDLVPLCAQQARQWGLLHEDPAHLLALLPRCPIPGAPSGVLAGRFPGGSMPARVVWFEQGGRTTGSVRGGVILAASPGASTAVGGVLHPQTESYVEVVEGTAYCWRKARSFGTLDADALVAAAAATLDATQVAAF